MTLNCSCHSGSHGKTSSHCLSISRRWRHRASTGHEPGLVGAVIGFVSAFETQTFQCVGSLLEGGNYVSDPVGDLRKGLVTRNVTEISQGVSVISHLLNNNEGTKENCPVDTDHVGVVFIPFKAYHSSKKLISHVVPEFVHDGNNIFDKVAFADYDSPRGDHFNAGANLGMALFRSLVGEFNAQPGNTMGVRLAKD